MSLLAVDTFVEEHCAHTRHEADEYANETPRWCAGCGDHSVLRAVQQLLEGAQVAPENVVAVSGIGCSSRLPHYLGTYGFHGIHGRALPVALGIKLARPELRVLAFMGDGDCFSIGAGHWLHTLRYNPDLLCVVMDNNLFALTKNQASPTTAPGERTNTTPRGAVLPPLRPLSVMLGISNLSFLAQSATWNPAHLRATLEVAWQHRGLSFVRVLQRCPAYMPELLEKGGSRRLAYLVGAGGVPIDARKAKGAELIDHDPADLAASRALADREELEPMGLLYRDPGRPSYGDLQSAGRDRPADDVIVARLEGLLDRYAVGDSP